MRETRFNVMRETDRFTESITGATKTLDIQDSGKVMTVTITSVITLPSTVLGARFELVNGGARDGAVQITVSPAALDQIKGADITAADNKDLVNTLATSRVGDRIVLIGDGDTGWVVQDLVGTWARQA